MKRFNTTFGTRGGFSLVEILIALFIFMMGCLGVLAVFPVAMKSATDSMGEVRANILAQSALAQLSADCSAPYERGIANGNSPSPTKSRELLRPSETTADWTGYFVTLLDEPGRWQSRLITGIDSVDQRKLLVTPDWTPVTVTSPTSGTWSAPGDLFDDFSEQHYVITRMGLPDPTDETQSRDGLVREFVGTDSIRAGTANYINTPTTVDALSWSSPSWFQSVVAADKGACTAAGPGQITVTGSNLLWRGRLIVLTDPPDDVSHPAGGQTRLITAVTGNVLSVYPNWAVVPAANDLYEIRPSLGYFLVITTGRAAGRIFPITGYTPDSGLGDLIECKGVDFREFGVTQASRGGNYNLQDATGFFIVGSDSFLGTLYAYGQDYWNVATNYVVGDKVYRESNGRYYLCTTAGPGQDPLLFPGLWQRIPAYQLNSFGLPKTAERQAGPDVFSQNGKEKETSMFHYICIFSNNGAVDVPADGPGRGSPVRVDTFVFPNYDSAKTADKNRRPSGFITGYIGRP